LPCRKFLEGVVVYAEELAVGKKEMTSIVVEAESDEQLDEVGFAHTYSCLQVQ
jgi:hypothetical protein